MEDIDKSSRSFNNEDSFDGSYDDAILDKVSKENDKEIKKEEENDEEEEKDQINESDLFHSGHFEKAKVDQFYKSTAKSSQILITKSKITLDDFVKIEEEIRLNLDEQSDFILDESGKYYRRKLESEKKEVNNNVSERLAKALRSKTANNINTKEFYN